MENLASIKGVAVCLEERIFTTMQTDLVYDYTPSFVRQSVLSRSRFTGKERDAESGLDYFGGRYYSSNMGRFSSLDPSGLEYAEQ